MRFGARMKVILLFWLIPWLALLCSSLACSVGGGRGLSVSRWAAAEWFLPSHCGDGCAGLWVHGDNLEAKAQPLLLTSAYI